MLGYHPPGTRQTSPRSGRHPPGPGSPPDQTDPPGPDRLPRPGRPPRDQADPPGPGRLQHMVYERPVRILLECILVFKVFPITLPSSMVDDCRKNEHQSILLMIPSSIFLVDIYESPLYKSPLPEGKYNCHCWNEQSATTAL